MFLTVTLLMSVTRFARSVHCICKLSWCSV